MTASDIGPAKRAGLTLSSEQVKAILAYACKDETRFHLGGLYFGPRDIVATDGHRLIAVPVRYAGAYTGPESGLIVPAADLALASKSAGARGTVEIRILDGGPKVSLHAQPRKGSLITMMTAAIAATFPPYDQVIPADGALTGGVSLDPKYLADLAPVAEAFAEDPDGHTERAIEISGGGGSDHLAPVLFRVGGKRGVRVVIMPMRATTYNEIKREEEARPHAERVATAKRAAA